MIAPKDALFALVRAELEAAFEPRELLRRGSDALTELADAATALALRRAPGAAHVRVSTPGGARAERVAVEILASDQPFIVDTVRLTLARAGVRARLLLHPLLAIERDADGSIVRLGRADVGARESYVYAELAAPVDSAERPALARELEQALADARRVVLDHGPMAERMREHAARVEACADALPGGAERARSLVEVLRWLDREGFLFMGYRRYAAERSGSGWRVELEDDSELGLLRDSADSRFADAGALAVPPRVAERLDDERVIFFDKTRIDATVHRRGRLDSVSVKLLDRDARVVGFGRFIGLLTHRAMRMRPSALSVLATRRAKVVEALRAEPGSHTHKLVLEAYDCLPVELLLPASHEDVTRAVARIVTAAERGQVEVASIADAENRSFFVTVALPRRLYEERFRGEIDALLCSRFGASRIEQRSSFLDEDLALVHFFCACDAPLRLDAFAALDDAIRARVERWEDRFESELLERHPAETAFTLAEAYAQAFPPDYRVVTSAAEAVLDVAHLERLNGGDAPVELGLDLATAHGDRRTHRLKLYLRERPYLTDLLPVVHQFGVRVVDATLLEVRAEEREPRWLVSFRIEPMTRGARDGAVEARVLDGLRAALSGRVCSDALDRLVLGASLDWRSIDGLRGYVEYARQAQLLAAGPYSAEALLRHPEATRALVALFRARLDPDLAESRETAEGAARAALAAARAPITSAAEDRVFGVLENLIDASLRTSFFTHAPPGEPHEIAWKLDSRSIRGLPAPAPFVEIFVHSRELVGLHLRGGPVARGGLRWSDRLLDLRTEVLSLWKTQRMKNGLIVPLGAKGAFALRRAPDDAKLARAEADRLYARFVAALLRVSDDVRDGRVVPPPRVVRHDGDDPYLVVAADKGTAHLSDVANRVAGEAGFWLGDAFASGGSNGYDHKREAITARGAWLCARRHFAELGCDPDGEPYSVAGIGDMSGDVFGNGLLLMRRAKLVAAFDHRHVFLDPDPDPESSWQERKRLFDLPRSSWADYARERISAGGGVFERGAKRIVLSPEARRALGVDSEALSGDELVRAVLSMPVDLLWNGGIGTYVKASSESHASAGDRANDSVRVDARELRARIVAEGGNLGLTQLGRVELALAGVRLDTDAIHNSGGVDLSDHEVNYKILLAPSVADGRLGEAERRELLRACVADAARDVLAHNASQSTCLSLDALRAREAPERFAEATAWLERHAELDARLEGLPDRETLRARKGAGAREPWTRPELAILLAYSKLLAKRALAQSSIPDHPALGPLLQGYFPPLLRERFAREIAAHRLRREISALALVNHVIDRAGASFVPEVVRAHGVSPADALAAFWTAGEILDADAARAEIQPRFAREDERLSALRRVEQDVREAAVLCLCLESRALYAADELALRRERAAELRALLAPEVTPLDALPALVRAWPAAIASLRTGAPLARALPILQELADETGVAFLLDRLRSATCPDAWSRVGVETLALDLQRALVDLVARELSDSLGDRELRRAARRAQCDALKALATEIDAADSGLAPLLVLSQRVRRLC